MQKQKFRIIIWVAAGFMTPPIFWLFFGWFFNIWSTSELLRLIFSPYMWIYVAVILGFSLSVFFNKLNLILTAVPENSVQIKSAQKALRYLPIFMLLVMSFYCTVGPNVAVLGQTLHNPFLDTTEYILTELLGIPLILLFTIIFYIMMVKNLEIFAKDLSLSEEIPFLSIQSKMSISIILNIIGSVLTLIIATLSVAYRGAVFQVFVFKLIVIGVTVVLVSLLNLLVLIRQIVQPIQEVSSGLSVVLRDLGDGKANLTQRVQVESRDEVGHLAQHFNQTLKSLAFLMKQFQMQGVRSKENSENIRRISKESLHFLSGIQERTGEILVQFDHMKQSVQESQSTTEEVSAFISGVVLKIREQNESVRKAYTLIEVISNSVHTLSDISHQNQDIADHLEHTAARGEELMNESEKEIDQVYQSAHLIGDLLQVIDDITDRTGMLAMNAAIEAAHAGEAGKGFSIVASEIRKLAENTSKNSKNIAKSLEIIVEHIRLSKESSGHTGEVFGEMVEDIRKLAEGMGLIESSMSEMSSENNEVVEHLKNLDALTGEVDHDSSKMDENMTTISFSFGTLQTIFEENNQRLRVVEDSISELNGKMEILDTTGEENFRHSEELTGLVEGFTVE